MAAGRIVIASRMPALDLNGDPHAGAKLYLWVNKTTTPASLYADEALTVPLPNPTAADAGGRFPDMWAEAGTELAPVLYSVQLTQASGAPVESPSTFDNYRPSLDYNTAAVALAENAASTAVSAGEIAQEALEQILELAAAAPEAPSVANKLNRDGDNLGDSGPELRTALQVIRAVTPEQAATASLAAAYAYSQRLPFFYDGEADLSVTLDFSAATTNAQRFAILKTACDWQSQCLLPGLGKVKLMIPDGLWNVGNEYIIRRAGQPPLWIEAASGAPDFINISGIAVTNVSGTLYEVTVTAASALPARVVAGFPIGLNFVEGDNSARAFSGAAQVLTVAPDRLSFTYRRRFYAAPTAPTTLSNTASSISGVIQSQLMIPQAAFAWSGGLATTEGFFNLYAGAICYSRYMGWSYTGTSTDGSVMSLGQPGTYWHCLDRDVFVGGPTKIIRAYLGASFYANRCCFGGNDFAAAMSAISTQGGGVLDIVRSSFGGLRTGPITIGQATQYYVVQNAIAGGEFYGVQVLGAFGLCYPNLISHVAVGISAELGSECIIKYGASATTISHCALGLQWFDDSRIVGAPTFASNTSNSQDAGNILTINGAWIRDTTLPLDLNVGYVSVTGADPIVDLFDGATRARMSGDAGHMSFYSHSTSRNIRFGQGSTVLAQFNCSNSTFEIGANKVLGARQTAVTKPTGGATVDAECRTALNALIDKLGTLGHGLIANT
jgi:hypothetical protein